MAHLLAKLGEACFRPMGGRPPLLTFGQAMKLREKFYAEGQAWPYEHLVPGPPQPPPGAEAYLQRQKAKEQQRQQRAKEIQDAMATMPQLIAQHKERQKLDWAEVTQLDKLTMTAAAIRRKYIKRRLTKAG